MQLTASVFSDPAMRPALQQYYEDKKAAAVEAWKAREEMPNEVKINMPDGEVKTATMIHISAEQMEKAFVSFDKWLELMAETFDTSSTNMQAAQERVAKLEENNPNNSSNVRATFSDDGALLAYINEDGTLVTSNGAEDVLGDIEKRADTLGLHGQFRIDYLVQEAQKALEKFYPDLSLQTYDSENSPSLREFANLWYFNYDADAIYNDALAEAKAHLDDVSAWHTRWQNNMYEMQSYLLKTQQSAS